MSEKSPCILFLISIFFLQKKSLNYTLCFVNTNLYTAIFEYKIYVSMLLKMYQVRLAIVEMFFVKCRREEGLVVTGACFHGVLYSGLNRGFPFRSLLLVSSCYS